MKDDTNVNEDKNMKVKRSSSLFDSFTRMGASVLEAGSSSKNVLNITVEKLRLADKQSFRKQPECQICFIEFSKFTRQHHCRICANAVCSACSYAIINKERACDTCAYQYSDPDRSKFKDQTLIAITDIAVKFIAQKSKLQNQLKRMDEQTPSQEKMQLEKFQQQEKTKRLNERLEELIQEKRRLEEEIAQIKA